MPRSSATATQPRATSSFDTPIEAGTPPASTRSSKANGSQSEAKRSLNYSDPTTPEKIPPRSAKLEVPGLHSVASSADSTADVMSADSDNEMDQSSSGASSPRSPAVLATGHQINVVNEEKVIKDFLSAVREMINDLLVRDDILDRRGMADRVFWKARRQLLIALFGFGLSDNWALKCTIEDHEAKVDVERCFSTANIRAWLEQAIKRIATIHCRIKNEEKLSEEGRNKILLALVSRFEGFFKANESLFTQEFFTDIKNRRKELTNTEQMPDQGKSIAIPVAAPSSPGTANNATVPVPPVFSAPNSQSASSLPNKCPIKEKIPVAAPLSSETANNAVVPAPPVFSAPNPPVSRSAPSGKKAKASDLVVDLLKTDFGFFTDEGGIERIDDSCLIGLADTVFSLGGKGGSDFWNGSNHYRLPHGITLIYEILGSGESDEEKLEQLRKVMEQRQRGGPSFRALFVRDGIIKRCYEFVRAACEIGLSDQKHPFTESTLKAFLDPFLSCREARAKRSDLVKRIEAPPLAPPLAFTW